MEASAGPEEGTWIAKLPPTPGGDTPHSITAKAGGATATLTDVLFGDGPSTSALPPLPSGSVCGGAPSDWRPCLSSPNCCSLAVWVCSGQSNMAFLLENAFNGSSLIADADNHPLVRLFTSKKTHSTTPLLEQPLVEQPWAVSSANATSDDGAPYIHLSPPCHSFPHTNLISPCVL